MTVMNSVNKKPRKESFFIVFKGEIKYFFLNQILSLTFGLKIHQMPRKKDKKIKKTNRFKGSITHIVRKLFDKNPSSQYSLKEICTLLDIREGELRKQTFTVLKDLVQAGYLKETGFGTFTLNQSLETFEGEIQITGRGAGFVICDGEKGDIYVSPKHTNHAMHGDRVKVVISKKGVSRNEGQVVQIVQRERSQFVGTIEMHQKFAFFIPDNQKTGIDIYIPKEKLAGAKNKDKVLVKITAWPKSSDSPFGEVLEVLGSSSTNDTEMLGILCNQGIDIKFPQDVIDAAELVTMDLDPEEVAKRRDFRPILTFTIDPVDAKDFDDAISFQKLENGNYEVGVHIADVSHYVQPDTPMDKEAAKRGNSVYLVDRVIPMLPEQLSNMACSLRPNEDKYSFSAVFEIDENAKVYKQWFGKTVIHSNRRFSYEQAQEIIEGKDDELKEEILFLDKIAKILRKKRLKSGALSIESEEMRFRLDENGKPVEVVTKVSKDAHKLIEEFMLLANKKVATFIAKPAQKNRDTIPFVYRIHDKPDPAKIETFKIFIDKFGLKLNSHSEDDISLAINELLSDIRLKNEYSLIQTMAIRSMAKATYDTENIGHYGLAFSYYTHFTSPIRRYADLLVHRILLEELTHQKHQYGSKLSDVCKHISKTERKATEAERESTKYFQTLFMEDRIGDTFEGVISGIADFGIFVKMTENQCEGMIPMLEIPGDRYYFDAEKYAVIGGKSKKEYNFGDKVKVKVLEIDIRKRQINLELIVD
jgi:ribonuclease R